MVDNFRCVNSTASWSLLGDWVRTISILDEVLRFEIAIKAVRQTRHQAEIFALQERSPVLIGSSFSKYVDSLNITIIIVGSFKKENGTWRLFRHLRYKQSIKATYHSRRV